LNLLAISVDHRTARRILKSPNVAQTIPESLRWVTAVDLQVDGVGRGGLRFGKAPSHGRLEKIQRCLR
jgi:hypothetical protein